MFPNRCVKYICTLFVFFSTPVIGVCLSKSVKWLGRNTTNSMPNFSINRFSITPSRPKIKYLFPPCHLHQFSRAHHATDHPPSSTTAFSRGLLPSYPHPTTHPTAIFKGITTYIAPHTYLSLLARWRDSWKKEAETWERCRALRNQSQCTEGLR